MSRNLSLIGSNHGDMLIIGMSMKMVLWVGVPTLAPVKLMSSLGGQIRLPSLVL